MAGVCNTTSTSVGTIATSVSSPIGIFFAEVDDVLSTGGVDSTGSKTTAFLPPLLNDLSILATAISNLYYGITLGLPFPGEPSGLTLPLPPPTSPNVAAPPSPTPPEVDAAPPPLPGSYGLH